MTANTDRTGKQNGKKLDRPLRPKWELYNPDGKYNTTDTVCHNAEVRSHS
ncbi:MAG: hypothetical protein ACRC62_20035 [Microcoleus sp.]